ncbi:MMPL family transporter [Kitasatospora atroaurantiaca]|uniref:RND superfamily putative drug exporter n=1 Tax=Kitasatospora atroaurantiaca TaxID=285545 RepID=A0A561EJQ9_9ACTN|nr:MMPL family transporter [Kitasatospora atroaurantiaca]TWE15854.1 RND superfamily putative drug exporter [Kitasatospora atroaurantiaca]
MAAFLYRLGRLAFRRRWSVVLVWVVVLCGVGAGAALAPAAPDSGFSMPGTESQKAFDLLKDRFPDTGSATGGSGAVARVVFVAPDGQKVTASQNQAAIEKAVAEVAGGEQVAGAASPFQAHTVSQDATTAYTTVAYNVAAKDLTDASKQTLRQAVQHAHDAGLTVEVGGTALATQPSAGGASEGIGIAVAAVVLLVTFGSLAAAGLPLLTAMISVGVGTASIFALGSAFGLSASTSTLATMLGLAVGIDYAVFIVSRYREERAKGHAPQEAASRAVGTAGSSVVFAGLTVVIGLAGLSVVGIPMLTKMGLAAAGTVVIAVLVALTLVPALLALWPRAVLPRRGLRPVEDDRPNGGTRWARFVLRRPLPVLILSVVGLGVIAVPVTQLHLGTAGDESKPVSTTERRAYDDLAQGFGPGFNGPLTIVVDARGAQEPKAAVATAAQQIGATEGVVSVSTPRFNPAGDTAVLSAVPATGPADTKTADLVHTLRAERPAIAAATGATFQVTGSTAVNIDSAQKVQDALIPYLAIVVGLAFVLLLVVFRSVLVPLKAALGFLLSVLAALGAVVAVFQWGGLASLLGVRTTGPIMSLMPIFMVGIVFGLAMDYEVFLVARIREAYVNGKRPAEAIVSGMSTSTRVVVAAALIMMAVFSGFIGSGESMIKMIGFGMAIAVLFDAFVVRMAIVPAALALLGRHAWWLPRRLDKALPRLDIEGEALHHQPAGTIHHTAEPTLTPTH